MHTLILGFDAFDPRIFERLLEAGKLPNLARYAADGGYAPLAVANPPQSEVSWTSIATGLNPGGHGIFDFVGRDPRTLGLYPSLLRTRRSLGGIQYAPPFTARTLFEEAAAQGYPATSLWWPATFPARPELPVRTLPGLGTPDIRGRLGVGTLLTAAPEEAGDNLKTQVSALTPLGSGRYRGTLEGPARRTREGHASATVELELELLDGERARLRLGRERVELRRGTWGPILEIAFRMGHFSKVHALTRLILTDAGPRPRLYALPLQIHPLHTPWRYASPGRLAREAWDAAGPFLSLGMPQDTTALDDGCIDAGQFLDLCDSIFRTREAILWDQLGRFGEGVLASVFDSLDRIQHVFWRDRPDIVDGWYLRLDELAGRVEGWRQASGGARVLVISDHGISEFRHKVHLNRWLIERGYQVRTASDGGLETVDWGRTVAYAVGLNSLYLNRAGREAHGCLAEGECAPLVDRLREELMGWVGPDGHRVVNAAWARDEAFEGPYAGSAPDLVIGYAPGYRASAETGTGKGGPAASEPNRSCWSSDHCIDPRCVPGVIFCSDGLRDHPSPSYRDVPTIAIGMAPAESGSPPPAYESDEEQDIVEDRLKGLGYL